MPIRRLRRSGSFGQNRQLAIAGTINGRAARHSIVIACGRRWTAPLQNGCNQRERKLRVIVNNRKIYNDFATDGRARMIIPEEEGEGHAFYPHRKIHNDLQPLVETGGRQAILHAARPPISARRSSASCVTTWHAGTAAPGPRKKPGAMTGPSHNSFGYPDILFYLNPVAEARSFAGVAPTRL
jgi:hypothetical protein